MKTSKTTKKDYLKELKADFPKEAYSKDTSRGFELTSLKAAYVIERLNEVFGLCGTGWKYTHSKFKEVEGEVGVKVNLYYKIGADWSEPISAMGGKRIIKNNLTDARKSAVTDGITKAASMLGIGHKAFKGLLSGNGQEKQQVSQESQPTRQGMISTAQIKKVYAMLNEKDMVPDQAIKAYKAKYKVASFNDLTTQQASEIINGLEA